MSDELRAKLDRVAQHEASVRNTLVGRLLQWIGPSRAFTAVYRRIGPMVDPWMMRASKGRVATQLYGMPALLLSSKGAKSGQPRTSPLLYTRDGDDFLVVGTNFGTKNHPAWTANLIKHPSAAIEVGSESFSVTAELLEHPEFDRYWPRFVKVYRGYDVYMERLTARTPRMFRLRPGAR